MRCPTAPSVLAATHDRGRFLRAASGRMAPRRSLGHDGRLGPVSADIFEEVTRLEAAPIDRFDGPQLMDAIQQTHRAQQEAIALANRPDVRRAPELRSPPLGLLRRIGRVSARNFDRACELFDERLEVPVRPWVVHKNTQKRPGYHDRAGCERYAAEKIRAFFQNGGRARDIMDVTPATLGALATDVPYEWVVDAYDRARFGRANHTVLSLGEDVLGAGTLLRRDDLLLVGTSSGHFLTSYAETEHMKRHIVAAGWDEALVITQGGEAGTDRSLQVVEAAMRGPGQSSPPGPRPAREPAPFDLEEARRERALGSAASRVRLGARVGGAAPLSELVRGGCSFLAADAAFSSDETVRELVGEAAELSAKLGRRVTVGFELSAAESRRPTSWGDPRDIGFVTVPATAPTLQLLEAQAELAALEIPFLLSVKEVPRDLGILLSGCDGLWFDRQSVGVEVSRMHVRKLEATLARAAKASAKMFVVATKIGERDTLGESERLDLCGLVEGGAAGLLGATTLSGATASEMNACVDTAAACQTENYDLNQIEQERNSR